MIASEALLDQVIQDLQQVIQDVQQHFVPLSEQALNQRLHTNSWSIAECLEHLNYYNRYYNNAIKKAIDQAKAANWTASQQFESTWLGKRSIASVDPSNRKKMKTARALNPSNSKVAPAAIDRFIQYQQALIALANEARNIDLNKAKVRIEVFKLFKLRLGDIFLFMSAHTRRHYQQAWRVLEQQQTMA